LGCLVVSAHRPAHDDRRGEVTRIGHRFALVELDALEHEAA
jgi:hypothetical protein